MYSLLSVSATLCNLLAAATAVCAMVFCIPQPVYAQSGGCGNAAFKCCIFCPVNCDTPPCGGAGCGPYFGCTNGCNCNTVFGTNGCDCS